MKFKQKQNTTSFIVEFDDEDIPSPALEIGRTYYCYDDGKISFSRIDKFTIVEQVDLDAAWNTLDEEWREAITDEVYNIYWLFQDTQKIIYRGVNREGEERYFLSTHDGGWFATGWLGGGRLDYNNRATIELLNYTQRNLSKYGPTEKPYMLELLDHWFGTHDIDQILQQLEDNNA